MASSTIEVKIVSDAVAEALMCRIAMLEERLAALEASRPISMGSLRQRLSFEPRGSGPFGF